MGLISAHLRVLGKPQEEILTWNTLHKEVGISSPEHFKNAACKPLCPTDLSDLNNEIYLDIDCADIGENENSQIPEMDCLISDLLVCGTCFSIASPKTKLARPSLLCLFSDRCIIHIKYIGYLPPLDASDMMESFSFKTIFDPLYIDCLVDRNVFIVL